MINKVNSKKILFGLYLFALFVFAVHFFVVGKGVYGDGRYYYSYLPSLLIEHTLNLTNSFKHLGIVSFLTPLKLPANIYPIGPAIIWTIPFFVSHLLLMSFNVNDGYNNFYQFAIGIWNITLVFIGLYYLKKTLAELFSEKIAILTTSTIFLATNLLFYGAVDVINSHSASFFASSLFFYYWLNKKIKLSGVLLGLLVLIRPQDAIFIILPLSSLIIEKRSYIKKFLIVTITSMIAFSPQLLIWKILWGTWYVNPYLKVESFNLKSPQILGVLFNSSDGLFLWTPIVILCLIGLINFAIKNKDMGIPFILLFLGQLYIVSSWSIWWQGSSYSGRMFISSLPILAFGIAHIYSSSSILSKFKIQCSVFFSFLNIILIILFLLKN